MITPHHCPPVTVNGRSVHSTKLLPVILQPSSVALNSDVRRKSSTTKAVPV